MTPLRLAVLAGLLLALAACTHRDPLPDPAAEIAQERQRVPRPPPHPQPAVTRQDGIYVDARPQELLSGWPGTQVDYLRLAPGTGLEQLEWLAALAGLGLRLELDGPDAEDFALHLHGEPRLGYAGGPALAAETLRDLGAHLGMHLRHSRGALVAANRVRRSYALSALAASSSQRLVESPASGLGAGLSGTQTLVRQLDLPELIRRQLAALGTGEAEVSVAEELASVVVRVPAVDAAAVDAYMRRLNEDLSRQVEVDVRLLEIQMEDESGSGISWSLFHSDLAGSRELSLVSGGLPQPSLQVRASSAADPADVVEALIGIFRRQGDVQVLTSPRGVTLNHQLMRIALQTQTSYLARTTSTLGGAGVGTAVTGLEPGTVESGFSMLLLPRVERGHVVLHMAMDISSLDSIDAVESAGQSIQVPVVTRSRFSHRVRIADGHTLVLGGVRQLRSNRSSQGFTGRGESLRRRVERVLLVTPRVRLGSY